MKNYFISVILLLVSLSTYPQENYWVHTQLPGPLPYYYKYALGETCIIFADDTSQSVYAFDINFSDWQVLLVPTQLDWIDAVADGNAAMIFNDSVVVGYSAITNSFSAINYIGTLLTISGEEYGCIDNFAFFVTDQLFYVFDAEDAQWRSFSYTPPGAAPWGGGVFGKEDYIYLTLWITNEPPVSLTAYSLHTKTFSQFINDYLTQPTLLDHGFTFIQSHNTPYLCLGYSAYNGQFNSKSHSSYITDIGFSGYEEIVSPIICHLFVTSELVSGNIRRFYMWIFNTEIGDFVEYTFEYNASEYVPVSNVCGGQTAYLIIRNELEGDKLECLLYSAPTNSFSQFDTPLFNWGLMSFTAGGLMIDGYDEENYFLYDVQTQAMFTHPVQWTQGIQPGVQARALGNYWNVFAYTEQYEDTVHVFSYNRTNGSLYSFDITGRASTSAYRGSEFYGLLINNLGVPVKTFLYSPAYNNWTEKDLSSTSYRGSEGNYFYVNYTGLNQTYFYDGQANQEYLFPSAQQASHVFARDSVFLMYSGEGKYIGYSMNKHSNSEYVSNRLPSQQWKNFMVLNHNGFSGSLYDHLLYDGYNNVFAPLILTPEQGIRIAGWSGGKTVFIASENGYLFAYSPNSANDIKDTHNITEGLKFTLTQNYPNPFNPSTKIKYELSSRQFVTLKIFDVLGNEVETIVNEEKPSGEHEIQFNSIGLSSGVYFYQLKAGSFIQTKKMVFMK